VDGRLSPLRKVEKDVTRNVWGSDFSGLGKIYPGKNWRPLGEIQAEMKAKSAVKSQRFTGRVTIP